MNQLQINRINEIVQELNLLLPVLKSTHLVTGAFQTVGESIVGLAVDMVALPEPTPEPEPAPAPTKTKK